MNTLPIATGDSPTTDPLTTDPIPPIVFNCRPMRDGDIISLVVPVVLESGDIRRGRGRRIDVEKRFKGDTVSPDGIESRDTRSDVMCENA